MEHTDWKFDEEVSETFDKHVREHVPHYDIVHDLVAGISEWFVEDGTNVYDLGTSLGEVIGRVRDVNKARNAQYIGYDLEDGMVAKASSRFKGEGNVTIEKLDITSDKFHPSNASLVVSALTFMFIPHNKRLNALRKVYDGLNKGGAFIWIEKELDEVPEFNEMMGNLYGDLKLRNGVSKSDIFDKTSSIRGVLKPNSSVENESIIRGAGFDKVSTFYRWGNFVGYVAIK